MPPPASPDELSPAWLTAVLREAGVLRRGAVAVFLGVVAILYSLSG